jgi:GNAT superfamily N-acetyltransferase
MSLAHVKKATTPEDWAAVIDLDYLCFEEVEPVHISNQWWIAKIGKTPVGFAGASIINAKRVFLCKCGVAPEWRGLGLQRKFIRIREWWARQQNAREIITYTICNNIPSANNLISCGYKMYQNKRLREDCLSWRKKI